MRVTDLIRTQAETADHARIEQERIAEQQALIAFHEQAVIRESIRPIEVFRKEYPVLINPGVQELLGFMRVRAHGQARVLLTPTDCFVWSAYDVVHDDMALALEENEGYDMNRYMPGVLSMSGSFDADPRMWSVPRRVGPIWYEFDHSFKGIQNPVWEQLRQSLERLPVENAPRPPERAKSAEEKRRNPAFDAILDDELLQNLGESRHEIGQFTMLENPTAQELIGYTNRYHQVRGIIDADGNLWFWQAELGVHEDGLRSLIHAGLIPERNSAYTSYGKHLVHRLQVGILEYDSEYRGMNPVGPIFMSLWQNEKGWLDLDEYAQTNERFAMLLRGLARAVPKPMFTPTNVLSAPLHESVLKKDLILYHGTDSNPFSSFAPQAAAKGTQFWNPLGNGMYATDSEIFARNFGKRVHPVRIPAGARYRTISDRAWQTQIGPGLVNASMTKVFRNHGLNWQRWNWANAEGLPTEIKGNVPAQWRMEMYRSFQNSPYESLYEMQSLVELFWGPEIGNEFATTLAAHTTALFGKWDFIVFSSTNDVIGVGPKGGSAKEIVIFNPEYQRTDLSEAVVAPTQLEPVPDPDMKKLIKRVRSEIDWYGGAGESLWFDYCTDDGIDPDGLPKFGSPRFKKWLLNWFEDKAREIRYTMIVLIRQNSGSIPIFRQISAPAKWDISAQPLGRYWTYDENKAEAHWGKFGGNMQQWVMIGMTKPNQVDWFETIARQMAPSTGEDEAEIYLLPNQQIDVTSVFNKTTGKVFPVGRVLPAGP